MLALSRVTSLWFHFISSVFCILKSCCSTPTWVTKLRSLQMLVKWSTTELAHSPVSTTVSEIKWKTIWRCLVQSRCARNTCLDWVYIRAQNRLILRAENLPSANTTAHSCVAPPAYVWAESSTTSSQRSQYCTASVTLRQKTEVWFWTDATFLSHRLHQRGFKRSALDRLWVQSHGQKMYI